MPKTEKGKKSGKKSMKKKNSKTVRVTLKQFLYLYEIVGDERPMKEAVQECIDAREKLQELEDVELENV